MIPSQYYSFSGIVVTLYFFFLASCVLQILASPTPHYCRNDQRDALLEFKQEFPGRNMNSSSYNDMSSWNKKSDCCYWGAVVCDAKSGQVISLDLSKVALNNSLKPNSGLFKLLYLQRLYLLNCNLYGEVPSSFGNLSHLMELDLSINNLDGQVPSSIANLTQLRYLRLLENNLSGKFSVSLANLTNLVQLEIGNNYFEPELLPDMSRFHNLAIFWGGNFFGPFPTSLFTIPSLQWVDLGENNFTGPISFGNMSLSSSRLMFLSLEDNKLDGPIPKSMSKFLNLEQLDLRNNSFSGPFPTFLLTIPSLTIVNLAQNHFKGPIDFEKTSSSSSLGVLNIADNKFDGQIPESISKFHKLGELDVSNNKLEGNVPGCLLSLASLKLSHNSFTSVGKSSSQVSEQAEMRELRLDSNSFRGPFPYWICEMRSLEFLDMSNNSFSGSIPPCFRDITKFLEVLNLRNNNFSGNLPDVFVSATKLILLDVSRNRLVGKLPKSLINCIAMEFLNVEGNKFKDKFPSWLSSLLSLKVLILRSNQFYHPHVSVGFQRLKVIDVSHNDLTGTFPDFYFSDWFGMCQTTTLLNLENDVIYMEYLIDMNNYEAFVMNSRTYSSSMEMVYKGVDTKFEKIRKDFRAIDFSRNRFYGNIPESIGLLKGLRFLNLSSNAFTSNIPHSLANLTNLEALDVSHNQLSGQIPQDLGELSFLSTMNFAHNNLEGPIPRGTQFQRQNCSSFMDNPKLYGLDDDICRKTHVPNPAPQKSEEEQMISWIALAIAYGPGVFCGLVIGHIFISHKHEWFMERFRRNNPRVVIRSAR